MKTTLLALGLAMAVTGMSACSINSMNTRDTMSAGAMAASDNPMVGGAAMLRGRDIIDNAVNSADHTIQTQLCTAHCWSTVNVPDPTAGVPAALMLKTIVLRTPAAS